MVLFIYFLNLLLGEMIDVDGELLEDNYEEDGESLNEEEIN